MICFAIELSIPSRKPLKALLEKSGEISDNAAWEFNCYHEPLRLFAVKALLKTHCDHAGLSVELALLGLSAEFMIYDTRHWDYEENRWCSSEEEP